MPIDPIDLKILNILQENAKLSFKEIGDLIPMTGQAVGVRIHKLMESGIIENFTIKIDKEKIGIPILAIIKVYMKTFDHAKLIKYIEGTEEVVEAYRVSGDGCYFLKVETDRNQRLNEILEGLCDFANYQLSLSVKKLK